MGAPKYWLMPEKKVVPVNNIPVSSVSASSVSASSVNPSLTFRSGVSILPTLSRVALPASFALMGVQTMTDYAKSLYQQKFDSMENLGGSTSIPPLPDGGSSPEPEPQPDKEDTNFVPHNLPPVITLVELIKESNHNSSEIAKTLSAMNNNFNKNSFPDLSPISKSVDNLSLVVHGFGSSMITLMSSLISSISSPEKSVLDIEYTNLQLQALWDLKSSVDSLASSFSFPESVGVDIKSLNPIQEQYLQKELYKQDIEIPMREKQSSNLDNEIALTNKKLESVSYDLTPVSLDNLGDTIPSLKPIEMRALNNAVTAKFISDNNTLEFDNDDFDISFDFPDFSSIFDFVKKSDRLTDLRSSL